MFDRNELRAAMARFGDRQEDLANALGVTSSALSAKINGSVDFKRNDIEMIIMRYGLTAVEPTRKPVKKKNTANQNLINIIG